jgi:signal transduction histidine kinase
MPVGEYMARFDKDLMSQVLINLIKNSVEAMAESRIRQLSVALSKGLGDKVVIRLSDTGPGMDAETVENIFVPFYTTKKAGTGIGLSLSRQIVKAHGGTIRVASTLGKGTTFEIQF